MKHVVLKTTLFVLALLLAAPSYGGGGDLPSEFERGAPLSSAQQETFLKRLEEVRSAVQTLDAAFKEVRTVPPLDRELRYEGRLYYNAQGIFFMDYRKPVRHILRITPTEVVSYVEGSPTADVMDISSVEEGKSHPDLFGWGGKEFQGKVWETPTTYIMERAVDESESDSGSPRAMIFLDKERLLPAEIRITNDSGDRTIILLSDIHMNRALPPYVTGFSLPEDVKENRIGPQ